MQNKNKTIGLIVTVVVIAGVISYLQYSKDAGRVNVAAGSADIPISVTLANDAAGANGTSTLTAGQCATGYCTTTPGTTSLAALNAGSANSTAALSMTLAEEAAKYPRAKELVSPDGFINSPDGAGPNGPGSAPFKIADLIGKKVVIVDFWTYSCINCQRTLPYMNAWYNAYKDDGLEIIGVETPEFDFEKSYSNVQAAVQKYGIQYPVVQDNEYGTWNAYQNL